jgi:predicted Zn finger-like uncharacterized protein
MFRVVPDQLRISEGWVRCGHCDEVFDANAHLRTLEETPRMAAADAEPVWAVNPELLEPLQGAEVHLEAPSPSAPPPQIQATGDGRVHDAEPCDWGPAASPQSASDLLEILGDVDAPLARVATRATPQAAPFLNESPQESRQEPKLEPEQFSIADPVPADSWMLLHEQEVTALDHNEALDPAVDALLAEDIPLSFLSAHAAPSWASRAPGKRILQALCTLLVLLLGLQILLSERDRMYASAPALRPLLVFSCRVLGCTIAPYRQIDAIAIDSSSFTSVKPGVYLLMVTLKNTAAIELAMPALELTLTDTQDQPLLRRIVLATEFKGQGAIASGGELVASLPVRVNAGAFPEKISGYKLLAFYP